MIPTVGFEYHGLATAANSGNDSLMMVHSALEEPAGATAKDMDSQFADAANDNTVTKMVIVKKKKTKKVVKKKSKKTAKVKKPLVKVMIGDMETFSRDSRWTNYRNTPTVLGAAKATVRKKKKLNNNNNKGTTVKKGTTATAAKKGGAAATAANKQGTATATGTANAAMKTTTSKTTAKKGGVTTGKKKKTVTVAAKKKPTLTKTQRKRRAKAFQKEVNALDACFRSLMVTPTTAPVVAVGGGVMDL